MTERVSAIVIGAGVIGLAIARRLAKRVGDVLILEGEAAFGTSTSARNSEVIHAGIYYPEKSLKAELCVRGRHMLYAFCQERGVPHRQTGKIIFAQTLEQMPDLARIRQAAIAADVNDLILLSAGAVREREPELDCHGALLSPSTGIVDSHALMFALLGEAEADGAILVCNSKVEHVSRASEEWRIHLVGSEGAAISAPILVNAAGLQAQSVAKATEDLAAAQIPPLHLAKGNYFTYSGRAPFSHLIYPVPVPGGLGTHLTLDLGGSARFGPDVEWIDDINYAVSPERKDKFVAAARKIWPGLDPDRLSPGYAGIRPKLSAQGAPAADFAISGPADHGLEGLVNLFGIESPGLTSCLAIGQYIDTLLLDRA